MQYCSLVCLHIFPRDRRVVRLQARPMRHAMSVCLSCCPSRSCCDVRATRRHLLYCTVFRFCTLVHFRCCFLLYVFDALVDSRCFVPVLHVCLVIMAGNCLWYILDWNWLVIVSGIFWTGIFEMPEVYIMVDYVVDRSLVRAVR